MSYKTIINHMGKYDALKISAIPHSSETMKNSFILKSYLCDACLFPTELLSFFYGADRTRQELQNKYQ